MDIQQALLERRTVHTYSPEPVPEPVLEQALEAAHHAPNHKLTFPWRFTLVGPERRRKLADLNVTLKCGTGPVSETAAQSVRSKLLNPGVLIAVSQIRSADAFRSREDYAAVACAIQNFMLSLWGAGYGSKWSTGGIVRNEATYRLLEIDPEREEIVGFVLGGIPDKPPTAPKRPPLADVVRRLP